MTGMISCCNHLGMLTANQDALWCVVGCQVRDFCINLKERMQVASSQGDLFEPDMVHVQWDSSLFPFR